MNFVDIAEVAVGLFLELVDLALIVAFVVDELRHAVVVVAAAVVAAVAAADAVAAAADAVADVVAGTAVGVLQLCCGAIQKLCTD